MTGRDVESELRRVLGDASRRIPDSLVTLDRVHAGARRRRNRRRVVAAVGGAAALAAVFALVPFQLAGRPGRTTAVAGVHNSLPSALTPSSVTHPSATSSTNSNQSPPIAAAISPSHPSVQSQAVPAGFVPVSVTATSVARWWVLGSDGSVVVTRDGGRSFFAIAKIPGDSTTGELRFATDISHGWAISVVGGQRQLFWTADAGHTWRPTSLQGSVESVEAGSGNVYALVRQSGKEEVWRSTNTGLAWEMAADVTSAVPRSSSSGGGPGNGATLLAVQKGNAIVASAGSVWVVGPFGSATLVPSPCGATSTPLSMSAADSGVWMSCPAGSPAGLFRSDTGTTWVPVVLPGTVVLSELGTIDSSHVLISQAGSPALQIVTAGTGSTGAAVQGAVVVAGGVDSWTYLAFTNPTQGFALDAGRALFRTTDGGSTWNWVRFR